MEASVFIVFNTDGREDSHLYDGGKHADGHEPSGGVNRTRTWGLLDPKRVAQQEVVCGSPEVILLCLQRHRHHQRKCDESCTFTVCEVREASFGFTAD